LPISLGREFRHTLRTILAMGRSMSIDIQQNLLKQRRTRIVATVGPASSDGATLAALITAGVDVFRLNMSHGTHAGHRAAYAAIREAASACGREVAVLADLCGPKIRCGLFEGDRIDLVTGSEVLVTTRQLLGRPGLIPSQYAALHEDVRPGARILLDDGNLELRVEAIDGQDVRCHVVQGGMLKNKKGINLPDVAVSAPALTDQDRMDARFSLALGVDYLALSFVRHANDIAELRQLIVDGGVGADTLIIAKIEKPEALGDIDAILDAADGIMVARGDLGVELPAESVPFIQSELIDRARARSKPVIVATQMLESMIGNPRPTRAEVSDVSTAVMAGADAVMLSAETASGAFPLQAVATMDRVARQTEAYLWRHGAFESILDGAPRPAPIPLAEAVAKATSQLSRDLQARAIFVVSGSGLSARRVSSGRPAAPIVAVSSDLRSVRRMCLLWGVVPSAATPEALQHADALARQRVSALGLATPGQRILKVSGFRDDGEQSSPNIGVLLV
jgi:pyruvate kinase